MRPCIPPIRQVCRLLGRYLRRHLLPARPKSRKPSTNCSPSSTNWPKCRKPKEVPLASKFWDRPPFAPTKKIVFPPRGLLTLSGRGVRPFSLRAACVLIRRRVAGKWIRWDPGKTVCNGNCRETLHADALRHGLLPPRRVFCKCSPEVRHPPAYVCFKTIPFSIEEPEKSGHIPRIWHAVARKRSGIEDE